LVLDKVTDVVEVIDVLGVLNQVVGMAEPETVKLFVCETV
jgi:hypothetical protein